MTATLENTGPNPVPCDDPVQEPVYADEVTEVEIAALNEVANDDDFDGWEIVDGPAW